MKTVNLKLHGLQDFLTRDIFCHANWRGLEYKTKLSEENILRETFENNVGEFKSYEDFIDYCNEKYGNK